MTQRFGSMLFDLHTDPEQMHPINDPVAEHRMVELMVELMRRNEAPSEQFERLGLPASGPITAQHLAVDKQRQRVDASFGEFPSRDVLRQISAAVDAPFAELMANEAARRVVEQHLPVVAASNLAAAAGGLSLYEVAAMLPADVDGELLTRLMTDLAAALRSVTLHTD